MTTDREQHELAARAAGLLLLWKTGHCKGGAFEAPFIGDQPWRPKDDDGDALRLALKVNLIVHKGFVYTPTGKLFDHRDYANPTAATRRAIFRAAVEIGRNMP